MISWVRGWRIKLFPKYKLRRICRVIGIQPSPWQREFALNGASDKITPDIRFGRQIGKTTALMLRLLMLPRPVNELDVLDALREDPDFDFTLPRATAYNHIYLDYARRCREAGIEVPIICFQALCMAEQRAAQLYRKLRL